MKKYLIFDLDWTLIESQSKLMVLVINYLVKNFSVDAEKVRYIASTTRWTWLPKQIEMILWISEEKAKKIANDIYEEINKNWTSNFFTWVPEKILELSKDYKLFLSTWNSTKFAEENLKKWWIYECFEYILWSENISKSEEHIKFFKEKFQIEDFEENSIFIWDWEKDREIAKNCWIDFIHIDENLENKFWDKYEIKSIAEISNILNSNL